MSNVLEIIPLGGIGEFGMNCMAVRYDDEMIVIDAGMGFPEESAYGVDVCVPDFDFLEEYRENLTAIVLTHGHEDHLGALTYILKKFNLPLRLALHFVLAEKKLEEHDLVGDVLLHRVEPRQFALGRSGRVIRGSHSLGCFSLAITPPVGTIPTPCETMWTKRPSSRTDCPAHFAQHGQRGCWLSIGSPTRRPGRTPSDRAVIPASRRFSLSGGRISVPPFASSIHRLQSF